MDEEVDIINLGLLEFCDTIKNLDPNLVLNQGIVILVRTPLIRRIVK